jgi:hypothetical protein
MSKRRQKDLGGLVPIDPKRLEEARLAVGLTVSQLARRAGVRQQTVDAIRRAEGKDRRCRQVVRDRLAGALGLPKQEANGSKWLGGEVPQLYLSVRRFSGGGAEFHYQNTPAAIDIARVRLMERCEEAWVRDASRPKDAGVPRPRGIPDGAPFRVLQAALERLTNCVWWRDAVLRGQMYPPTKAEYEAHRRLPQEVRSAAPMIMRELSGRGILFWDEMTDEARTEYIADWASPSPPSLTYEQADRIEQGLIDAFTALLEPWFAGHAEIDFRHVVGLALPHYRTEPQA